MPARRDLGFRFLALRLTSILLALLCGAIARPDAFGRFGYGGLPVPGFLVNKEGFKASYPGADTFRFPRAADKWKPVATSDLSQTIFVSDEPGFPQKLRVDLLSQGFSLYLTSDTVLELNSGSSPILTWVEGSVESGVMTPASNWLAISFRDSQPPVLLAFLDGPGSAIIEGQVGAWRLRLSYKGWIRITLPFGLKAMPTNTAGDLGSLVQQAKKQIEAWTQIPPLLLGVEIAEDPAGLTATWKFDKPGALIPPAAILSALGGYGLKILSPSRRVFDDLEGLGPLWICETADLKVRFPIKRLPTGRALINGEELPLPAKPSSEIAGIVETAFANLIASSNASLAQGAQAAIDAFLAGTAYAVEPATQQQLPYQPDGEGIESAAAYALLMQSIGTAEKGTSDSNSLLTSLTWRRDWLTWKVWSTDPVKSRRATALAAVAGALCPEPQRRLEAAMSEAGLAADRGLLMWRARMTRKDERTELIEPLLELRRAIFSFQPIVDPYLTALSSEMRLYSPVGVRTKETPEGLELSIDASDTAQRVLIMASSVAIEVKPGANVASIGLSQALGFVLIRIKPSQAGAATILVARQPWHTRLPHLNALPRYSEIVK